MFSKDHAYIIAEIGQNHQGDVGLAKEYVEKFASLGADAVKFQARSNQYLFDSVSYVKPYESENAFASTYGAHREALELTPDEMFEVRNYAKSIGVDFMCTPFDEPSLDLLVDMKVDALKVASFDLGNLGFLDRMARTGLPIVMSVGGGRFDQIKASVDVFKSRGNELSILHCVSEYPCTVDRLGLESLDLLAKEFPDYVIGLSDHFNGTLSGPIAYTAGARVFEKHVTFNRSWKGTDHPFALEPHGFESFVRDIRRVPLMFPVKKDDSLGKEYVFQKLGKSLVSLKDISAGNVLSLDAASGRIFETAGIPVRESFKYIGRRLKKAVKARDLITEDHFE